MLEGYNVAIFYIFITVETLISVPLELVIKNGIILLREEWWLRLAKNNILTTVVASLLTTKYQFL